MFGIAELARKVNQAVELFNKRTERMMLALNKKHKSTIEVGLMHFESQGVCSFSHPRLCLCEYLSSNQWQWRCSTIGCANKTGAQEQAWENFHKH